MTVDPVTAAFWKRQMATNPTLPRFDPDGFFDFGALLPPPPARPSPDPAAVLQNASVAMYGGASVTAQLDAVQQAIEAWQAG